MPDYNRTEIVDLLTRSDTAPTNAEKGRLFEDLVCLLFQSVPGIAITRRNAMNVFHTEEIDLAIWNDKNIEGFYFLNYIFLIECKNWSKSVGSIEVNWFAHKVETRGVDFGILLATNGITGDQNDISEANSIVYRLLERHIRMVVINRAEILGLNSTDNLVHLIKEKICDLTVMGRAI